ncbi:MAG: hypothetical protein ACJAXQ_001484 [Parvibaculaceae bacterium]|jgi:hypothetical protein
MVHVILRAGLECGKFSGANFILQAVGAKGTKANGKGAVEGTK